jgi:hypothetical protein
VLDEEFGLRVTEVLVSGSDAAATVPEPASEAAPAGAPAAPAPQPAA